MKAYLAEHPEIVTERLPSYAPETNPDENVWQHTKHAWLAKLPCCQLCNDLGRCPFPGTQEIPDPPDDI